MCSAKSSRQLCYAPAKHAYCRFGLSRVRQSQRPIYVEFEPALEGVGVNRLDGIANSSEFDERLTPTALGNECLGQEQASKRKVY